MVYIFKCNECGHLDEKKLEVEQRNNAFPCDQCETGVMRRDFKSEIKTTRIITWEDWCKSTAAMLRPTYEDDKAYDQSMQEFTKLPKKQYQREKEKRETFDKLHGMVEAGII